MRAKTGWWVAVLVALAALGGGAMEVPVGGQGVYAITDFGAKGDGKADDTGAIQAAIDRAAEKGGVVYVPPGRYLVAGSLAVKPGVAVVGINQAPMSIEPLIGSIILATGGRDNEQAPALFELGTASTVRGITVMYPDQRPRDIHPYPWTFHLTGFDNTVENVTLVNSYNGISVGPEGNVRHRIRSVYGCVLRRGLVVDGCTDIGRVENVQWHCHFWSSAAAGGEWQPVFDYMVEHLEAFVFGRTDWEYVTNTFVFPTNIGYRFIQTKAGACNGQFSGIGADAAQTCVQVDAIQYMGLLITNGQFVAFTGKRPVELVVSPTCTGQVRLVNCAFWGPASYNALLQGRSLVGLSDCFFSGRNDEAQKADHPLIVAEAGKVQIRGCSFGDGGTAIRLGPGLEHAIVTGNNGKGGVKIVNEAGTRATIRDNEPARPG